MNLLMLSGNSLHNRDWIEEASLQLPDDIAARIIVYYQHWETGGEWINLELEKEVLGKQQLQRMEPYGVFAKSIGTVLTVQAIKENIINPSFLLLMGLPLNFINTEYPDFKNHLASLDMPVTIIHNTEDKVGTSEEVKEFLGKNKHRFVELEAEGHDYVDYAALKAELKRLLA